MNPEEAVQAHWIWTAESIGMHFGTFQLTTEGIDEPCGRSRTRAARGTSRPHGSGRWGSATRFALVSTPCRGKEGFHS